MSQHSVARPSSRNVTLESAVEEAERRYVGANPESRQRYERALSVMPGGNTRTVLYYDPFPLTFTGGEGATLWDVDGHLYRDFLGEYSAGLYGHSQPAIRRAIAGALEDGIVLGGPNRYEADLAAELCRRFPSLDLVRFCNSGTEANLLSLSVARTVTGRPKAMVFDAAYHGSMLYFGATSPMTIPVPWVIAPFNDSAGTQALIERHAGELAAVLVEPMQGSAGCLPADRAFLADLRESCTRHGIVLIFDEVMTSRLSPGGLQAALGIVPDMTSFGKYLGGGLSFGAFGGRADIMARLDPRRPDALMHAGTFNNNVLAMAAGLAGLREVLSEEEIRRVNGEGDALRDRLRRIAERHALPVQVTGVGSLIGIHFSARPVRSIRDLAGPDPDLPRRRAGLMKLLHLDMIAHGQYFSRRGYISLSLPMVAADFDGLAAAFGEFCSVHGPVVAAAVG